MLKMLKYLKRSVVPIIGIVLLLIAQALCELSLPSYTSDIVNVGIQQGGISQAAPEAIRKSSMDTLTAVMSEEDRQIVLQSYELSHAGDTETAVRYPAVSQEDLYILTRDADTDVLNDIFGTAILITQIFSGDEQTLVDAQELLPQMVGDITSFSPEQRAQILEEMHSMLNEIPETLITQAAVSYIREEYQAIGLDVDQMQINYMLVTGAKMVGLALLSMFATILVAYLASRVAAALGQELRGRVFRKVVSFSNREIDQFSTASLITRSTNDIQQIQLLMVMLLRIVFYVPILGIGGVVKVLNTNTSMAWIILIALLAILTIVIVLFSVVMPKFKKMQKLVDRLNLVTREILTGLPVIRAFSTQKHEEKRFDKANRDLTKTNLFVSRTMALMMPLMMLVMNAITVLIVWNGSHSIEQGGMQVGDMMAFIQYTMQIIMAFLMISMISIMLPRASVSASRIEEVLMTDLSLHDPSAPRDFKADQKGVVEFRNVSFHYPQAEDQVLSDITFTAYPGQTTAIIGSTGCGKSTLVNLIPRFFDVTEGAVLVDGVDVREVNQHDLRERIGYVPQKGMLFSGTIASNIKYGHQELPDSQAAKAAEIAQALPFIREKSEGLHSPISQGGTNVSGGQKQRLSIARAIAKSPEIYIFDDSFSALDYQTDAKLRRALKEATGDSTVIIVAQRISTIIHAEQILVLEDGHIVGKGTHKELLNNCEVYRQIASSQLSKEELDA